MSQRKPTAGRLSATRHKGIFTRDGKFVVQVLMPDGKKVQRTCATLDDAKAAKARLIAERHDGTFVHRDPTTLECYAKAWLAGYAGRSGDGVRSRTVTEYERDLALHILPTLGRRPLTAIKAVEVKRLAKKLREGTAASPPAYKRRPLSPGSVRNAIAPLRALMGDALTEGLITVNPCAGLRLAGRRLGDRPKAAAYTPEQYAALVAATPAGWRRCLVRVMGEGGLRVSEALGLFWEDLHLAGEAPYLRVERAHVGAAYDEPKSAYGKRKVDLSFDLAAELAALRGERQVVSLDGEDPVFANRYGRPRDPGALRRRVLDPACEAAGVPSTGFHILRHTCATTMVRAGVPLLDVSRMLGHHSPGFTLSTYSHVTPTDRVPVDAIFGKGAR